jgi:hypothetical protein
MKIYFTLDDDGTEISVGLTRAEALEQLPQLDADEIRWSANDTVVLDGRNQGEDTPRSISLSVSQ